MALSLDRDRQTDALISSGWGITRELLAGLDDYTVNFMALELARPGRKPADYQARVDYLGIKDAQTVLDFGCGVGQWCIALAGQNQRVIGIDKSTSRITAGRKMLEALSADNVDLTTNLDGDAALAACSVDAIICYSALMFIDGRDMMKEFHRLLRPDGKLYVMVDLPAWHLRSLARSPKSLPAVGYMALRTLLNGQRNIIYTKRSLLKLVAREGFTVVSQGADGFASFVPPPGRPPRGNAEFLPNKFAGFQTLFEICALKN